MAKTYIFKAVGKVGKVNIKANRNIAKMWEERDIQYCEVCSVLDSIEGGLGWVCLQATGNAHRHSRVWYRSRPELLWDFRQVVRACQLSHSYIDSHGEIKEKVFFILRGKEIF